MQALSDSDLVFLLAMQGHVLGEASARGTYSLNAGVLSCRACSDGGLPSGPNETSEALHLVSGVHVPC